MSLRPGTTVLINIVGFVIAVGIMVGLSVVLSGQATRLESLTLDFGLVSSFIAVFGATAAIGTAVATGIKRLWGIEGARKAQRARELAQQINLQLFQTETAATLSPLFEQYRNVQEERVSDLRGSSWQAFLWNFTLIVIVATVVFLLVQVLPGILR